MNVFFDVDYTLIAYDGSLRPLVKETFEALKQRGHSIFLWSGVGLRWEVVEHHALGQWVTDCFEKPLEDHVRRLPALGIGVWPDFVVDDHPQVVAAFAGYHVKDYFWPDPTDREMQIVYDRIAAIDPL